MIKPQKKTSEIYKTNENENNVINDITPSPHLQQQHLTQLLTPPNDNAACAKSNDIDVNASSKDIMTTFNNIITHVSKFTHVHY